MDVRHRFHTGSVVHFLAVNRMIPGENNTLSFSLDTHLFLTFHSGLWQVFEREMK
jgi:hypothetical protein